MKTFSISLTDQHAAEIEAQIASGDYASVSEVVRAALREFLARGTVPDATQIDRDIAAYLDLRGRGEPPIDGDAALAELRARLGA